MLWGNLKGHLIYYFHTFHIYFIMDRLKRKDSSVVGLSMNVPRRCFHCLPSVMLISCFFLKLELLIFCDIWFAFLPCESASVCECVCVCVCVCDCCYQCFGSGTILWVTFQLNCNNLWALKTSNMSNTVVPIHIKYPVFRYRSMQWCTSFREVDVEPFQDGRWNGVGRVFVYFPNYVRFTFKNLIGVIHVTHNNDSRK